MDISQKIVDNIVVLKLEGQLNIASCQSLQEATQNCLDKNYQLIILDFNLIDYMSSAGIRSLYLALDAITQKQGKLALCNVKQTILKVLELVDLHSDIPIFASEENALAYMQNT